MDDSKREELMYCQHEGEYAWWARDAQGIELCKVCDLCEKVKLSRYRPEILSGYTQADVDEPIEPEDGDLPGFYGDGEDY